MNIFIIINLFLCIGGEQGHDRKYSWYAAVVDSGFSEY